MRKLGWTVLVERIIIVLLVVNVVIGILDWNTSTRDQSRVTAEEPADEVQLLNSPYDSE